MTVQKFIPTKTSHLVRKKGRYFQTAWVKHFPDLSR